MLTNLTVEPTTATPQYDEAAELPRVVPSRAVPPTVHKGLVVGTGLGASHSRYADAYHEAGPGETVKVKNDFVTDESFQLVDKGSDAGWIAFEPVTEIVPPGTRVTPAMLAHLPTLLTPDGGGSIACAPGAHHVRLSGIQIKPGTVKQGYQFITAAAPGPETATSQPHDILLDRMALVADPVAGEFYRRGIYHVMRGMALIDSWVVGFADANNSDSQAVALSGGDGQTLIDNNTLGALSENLLAGGADHAYLLGDLTFTRNHVWKDAAWIPFGSSSKNLFELKTMARALIAGNLFEQMFSGAQYQAIAMKSVNQDGTMPFAGTYDITFRRNVMRKICSGFNLAAFQGAQCTPMQRLSIHHNLMTEVNEAGLYEQHQGGPWGFFFAWTGPIDKMSIRHNIGRSSRAVRLIQQGEGGQKPLTNLHVEDNDLSGGPSSEVLVGDGYGYVENNWATYVDAASSTLRGNRFRSNEDYGGPRPSAAQAAANTFLSSVTDPEPTYDATDILAAVEGVDAGVPTAPAPVPVVPAPVPTPPVSPSPSVPPVLGLPTSADQKAMLASLARLEAAVTALTAAITPLVALGKTAAQAQADAAQAHADLGSADAAVNSIAAQVEGVVASIAAPPAP